MENFKDTTNKFYVFSWYGTQMDWHVAKHFSSGYKIAMYLFRIIVISSEGLCSMTSQT